LESDIPAGDGNTADPFFYSVTSQGCDETGNLINACDRFIIVVNMLPVCLKTIIPKKWHSSNKFFEIFVFFWFISCWLKCFNNLHVAKNQSFKHIAWYCKAATICFLNLKFFAECKKLDNVSGGFVNLYKISPNSILRLDIALSMSFSMDHLYAEFCEPKIVLLWISWYSYVSECFLKE